MLTPDELSEMQLLYSDPDPHRGILALLAHIREQAAMLAAAYPLVDRVRCRDKEVTEWLESYDKHAKGVLRRRA